MKVSLSRMSARSQTAWGEHLTLTADGDGESSARKCCVSSSIVKMGGGRQSSSCHAFACGGSTGGGSTGGRSTAGDSSRALRPRRRRSRTWARLAASPVPKCEQGGRARRVSGTVRAREGFALGFLDGRELRFGEFPHCWALHAASVAKLQVRGVVVTFALDEHLDIAVRQFDHLDPKVSQPRQHLVLGVPSGCCILVLADEAVRSTSLHHAAPRGSSVPGVGRFEQDAR